jgi:hypothetical protein
VKTKKYLVMVHIASRLNRSNLAVAAQQIAGAIQSNLFGCEAVMTSEICICVVGSADADAGGLFAAIAPGLRSGDNLSVIEMGEAVMTSHPGLAQWLKASPRLVSRINPGDRPLP